ncbi:MAG TPA: DUF5915 domain-containing protein, partial [Planctomycetota bacterium]|nr:DUF5915 domain-containing protein [Planctomycetota bacterium]
FESGSMPFAQVHYPFANKEWFEHHFPADFIVEYVAQTRGWFYTLVVLATALFDCPPFRHCMCHGVVLDEDGQKLSKRKRNYPDPEEVFATHGADAMRWFMVSSPILKGQDLQIDKEGKKIGEVVRTVINPIWNAWYFFALYANTDGVRARVRTDSRQLLDRYILAKTRALVAETTAQMDAYDLSGACATITRFLDALNNWYIRRSRERFWRGGRDQDKLDAYDTLFTVLHVLTRVCAPLLPLISEEIYRGLTGEDSVHLTDWPKVDELPADEELVRAMDRVRDACSAGLALREAHKLRIRLPLPALTVAGEGADALAPYADLLADELNVKRVHFAAQIGDYGTFKLQVNAKVLGPKLGPDMKAVLQATQTGDWQVLDGGRARVGPRELESGEWELRLQAKPGVASAALSSNDAVVVLDTTVTEELRAEGMARDLVRVIQQARKDAGLHVSDRILLHVEPAAEARAALEAHRAWIAEQTLAEELQFAAPAAGMHVAEGKVEAFAVRVGVAKRAG